GVLPFVTTFDQLDQRFPGHYLRLIRSVKVSVIALIPPGTGIRATLSSLGTSRVVLGNGQFDISTIRRAPESVALTSPLGATGLFELDAQPELTIPFEGMGFDAAWELRMPRAANPFDYDSIADVLVMFDYTALADDTYRRRVQDRLPRSTVFDRAFSFREE